MINNQSCFCSYKLTAVLSEQQGRPVSQLTVFGGLWRKQAWQRLEETRRKPVPGVCTIDWWGCHQNAGLLNVTVALKVGHALILSFWEQKYPSCSTLSIDCNCARMFANAHVKGTDRRLNWNRMISSAAVTTSVTQSFLLLLVLRLLERESWTRALCFAASKCTKG